MKTTLALIGLITVTASAAAFANNDVKMKKMCEKHMAMMDTNKDGLISRSENAAGAEAMFTKADTNNDGQVSKDEMMAAKKREMKEMKNDGSKMRD